MEIKQLLMIAVHKETSDQRETIPASIVKFYEDNSINCFDESTIVSSEQIYARPNKKINYSKLSIDDFKGKKGISEQFTHIEELNDYIETLIEDGYTMQRMTRHNENKLADTMFKHVMRVGISKTSKVLNF